jgi:hypothetical protein
LSCLDRILFRKKVFNVLSGRVINSTRLADCKMDNGVYGAFDICSNDRVQITLDFS